MPRKGNSEEKVVYALRQVKAGKKVSEVCQEMGVPVKNGYIESFNGRLRDECFNGEPNGARNKLKTWWNDYKNRGSVIPIQNERKGLFSILEIACKDRLSYFKSRYARQTGFNSRHWEG